MSYEFDAAVYNSKIYCTECLPSGINAKNEDVTPIFADSEWECAPVCCECGYEHNYINLIL